MVSRHILPSLFLLSPLLWLFRRALFWGETFVYRDAAHYYYPLYHYVDQRWREGLPLWNPLDGLGQPLLADPTAAVLYPGKLIFLLPGGFTANFTLYIVLHLWLAGCGAYWVSRRWRTSLAGAILCGLAYELGGQILCYYCNPIYGVSAAWLPWAIYALETTLRLESRRRAVLLGMVLSLMTFGGDPQMAYHVLLAGVVLLLTRLWPANQTGRQRLGRFVRGGTLLAMAAVVALCLAAAQVLPTWEWSSRSDRTLRDGPRSAAEWVADVLGNEPAGQLPNCRGMWRQPDPGDHLRKVYDFSVGPWRWPELLWPNISGRQFPMHRRWLAAIPAEHRVWTPTLYMGLLPILLALVRLRFVRGAVRTRWLSWCVLACVFAALGEYGCGWLINELKFAAARDNYQPSTLLPGIGGLYWWMTVSLPGYVSFRYPAKHWTLAALGFSLLAGKAWSTYVEGRARFRFSRQLKYMAAASAGLAALGWIAAGLVASEFEVNASPLFGPFDPLLARRDFLGALLQTTIVAGIMSYLVRGRSRGAPRGLARPRRQPFAAENDTRARRGDARVPRLAALLAVLVLELSVAQSWLIQTGPAEANVELGSDGRRMYRCEASRAYPEAWRDHGSPTRLRDCRWHDLETLLPRFQLLGSDASIAPASPFTSGDYRSVWEFAEHLGRRSDDGVQIPDIGVLSLLGVRTLIAPRRDFDSAEHLTLSTANQRRSDPRHQPSMTSQQTSDERWPLPDVSPQLVWHDNPDAFPRAWIVHRWATLPPLENSTKRALTRRTREVFLSAGRLRDFHREAVLELAARHDEAWSDQLGRTPSVTDDFCEVTQSDAERVSIRASVAQPGVLVLADQFFVGWNAYIRSDKSAPFQPTPTLRANRVMRGVPLPAGNHEIQFRFEPKSVWLGAWVSVIAWLACGAGWMASRKG